MSPCHLDLDVGHICSYGYLGVCVCDERGWEEASVCSSLHKKETLLKKINKKKQFGGAWILMPLQERVQQSSERNRGRKKSIYIILYCAEYL